MDTEKWFQKKLEGFREDSDYYAEELILDLTEQIISTMKKLNLNRTELASRLGVSKAHVTKLLNGNTNITLKTMAALARSLGCDVAIDLCPRDVQLVKVYKTIPRLNIDPGQFTESFEASLQEFENESSAVA